MQPKSGFLSSEFWITLCVVGLCAYVAADLSRPTTQVVASIVVALLKSGWYLVKRTQLKLPDGAP
jgi:hypothetical protein